MAKEKVKPEVSEDNTVIVSVLAEDITPVTPEIGETTLEKLGNTNPNCCAAESVDGSKKQKTSRSASPLSNAIGLLNDSAGLTPDEFTQLSNAALKFCKDFNLCSNKPKVVEGPKTDILNKAYEIAEINKGKFVKVIANVPIKAMGKWSKPGEVADILAESLPGMIQRNQIKLMEE